MKGVQTDLRSANAYILSILGLVFALFIPFSALILRIFQNTQNAAIILSTSLPLLAIILGVIGLLKSLKIQKKIAKISKILSILSILIGIILVIFNLYIFINSI